MTFATVLFQSDHDFDIISELSGEAGLTQMEEEARSIAKAADKDEKYLNQIYYTLLGGSCSDPDLVRKHLESGVLEKIYTEGGLMPDALK